MENTDTPKHKTFSYHAISILFFLVVVIILSTGICFTVQDTKIKDLQLTKTRAELDQERADKNSCVYIRDSLDAAVKELSIYKTLSQAMVHRDQATKQLLHKVGEMVYMKNDSSRVVIEDIVIGGSKYNYYIKYKVLYKDNISKEVIPELVY